MSLEYFLNQNNWLSGVSHGWGNGYVVIPPSHPFHGQHYDKLNTIISVHGGLTFSEFGSSIRKWAGYKPEYENCWIIGFDTCHYEDDMYKWPKSAVQDEVSDLAKQCEDFDRKYVFDINFLYFARKT